MTARPCEVADADGVPEADSSEGVASSLSVASSPSDSFEALLDALGSGLAEAAAPETSVARTGRK